MRTVLAVPTLLIVAVVGCTSPSAPSPNPGQTPNVEQTVQSRVAATVAAAPKPTTPPVVQPTNVPTRAPTQAPAPTATAVKQTQEAVTRSGKGITQTDPFPLAAGSYEIHWQAVNQGPGGCYHGGALMAVDQTGFLPQLVGNEMVDAGKTDEGTTNAYNLKAGRYYFSMSSGCQWTVTILPR